MNPVSDSLSVSTFMVEHTFTITTGSHRASIKFSDFPRISTLRSLFASVVLQDVAVEVRQNTLTGGDDGNLFSLGHIFVAIIPTNRDTDAASGASSQIVSNVPNKQTFPLSSTQQSNEVFQFNLDGYELDLAQDPRRGAGPVAWIGNSGVSYAGKTAKPICTSTWRIKVACSGSTPIWQ